MPELTAIYPSMVKSLCKSGDRIMRDLSPSSAHNLHMAVGIAGEAGELLDAVKRQAIYNQPLDISNVVEELGDLEFYMEGLRGSLGISREEVLLRNQRKLESRFPGGVFTNSDASARRDKG